MPENPSNMKSYQTGIIDLTISTNHLDTNLQNHTRKQALSTIEEIGHTA